MKPYIVREKYISKIEKYINKELIKVFIGQRRVGKSYILYQTIDLLKAKLPQANIIYINLELNEFEKLRDYQQLYNHVKSKTVTNQLNALLIDEIQEVEQFERALKSLLAEGNFDIYCTGSNANLLSGELATYLGGRYIEIPVYSLSYKEFLKFHKLDHTSENIEKYIRFGGLPYLKHLELNDETVFEYLENINQSILFRDVVSRFQIRNVDFLVKLVKFLANETGNIVSARNIVKFLKAQNIQISTNAVINYLNYLTSALLVTKVNRADIYGKKVFEIGEKYYFNDIGIRNSISGFSPMDLGQIIENVVFLHLKITGHSVLIGKQSNREVDFIAEKFGEKIYIQVALRITEQKTMEREFGNLKAIKDNYPKYVITLDEYTGVSHEGIVHLPLKKFLYEFE